jgi:signal transduction histidine kinase/ActR/RegA family two-component response regulator
MRLDDFIEQNIEEILVQWEAFARKLWRGGATDPATLRDHADHILRATVRDMRSSQSEAQQFAKSQGRGENGPSSDSVDLASDLHAVQRFESGFYLAELVAEYRALRASVIHLWRDSGPAPDRNDLDDLTRFHESIDQSLAVAIEGYMGYADRLRERLLANEQAARAEAEIANRAKDAFLATLSHELRTPLSAIGGWAYILGADGVTQDEIRQGSEVIRRNVAAQSKLIEDVLDVSRIISGKLRLVISRCDLTHAIAAAIDATRAAADAKGITIDTELDPEASTADCDFDRMQQVVWNLLSNAVKFTPTGGRITIALAREGDTLVIRVADTGMGIDPEFLPQVFERFRQADGGSRRQFTGLGLGLSIVKELVELHGGTVEAASKGLGHGSVLAVRLPMSSTVDERPAEDESTLAGAQNHRDPAAAGNEPFTRLDGLRVLVVDDEPDTRDILVKLLVKVGAEVATAGSVSEAIEVLTRDAGVNVLVSDIGMPEQDGFDLIRQARHLRRDAKDLLAVALTAFAGKVAESHVFSAGFQVHIPKPVDPHELIAVIARHTHIAKTRRTERPAQ